MWVHKPKSQTSIKQPYDIWININQLHNKHFIPYNEIDTISHTGIISFINHIKIVSQTKVNTKVNMNQILWEFQPEFISISKLQLVRSNHEHIRTLRVSFAFKLRPCYTYNLCRLHTIITTIFLNNKPLSYS